MDKYNKINIFVAYCSDAEELKDVVEKVSKEIDAFTLKAYNIPTLVKSWRKDSYVGMGNPESLILEQLKPDECNVFIGIFRFRFGTPTGNVNKDTGEVFLSGTEEEFYRAYQMWKHKRTPHIMIFKSNEMIPRDYIGENQIYNLNKYFAEFRPTGKYPGIYQEFDSKDNFEIEFRRNIWMLLKDILYSPYLEKSLIKKDYFENVFNNDTNAERNRQKSYEIKNSKTIRVFAKTGYSFLAQSNQFYGDLECVLSKGGKIQIIILNPWSVNAIYTAFCEEINKFKESRENKKVFCRLLSNDMTGEEVVKKFMDSRWYKKIESCIDGYINFYNRYKNSIQLKFSNVDSESSIFISENKCFFEPYLNSMNETHLSLPLYETVINKNENNYQYIDKYFNEIWKVSLEYNTFIRNWEIYKKQITHYFDCGYKLLH